VEHTLPEKKVIVISKMLYPMLLAREVRQTSNTSYRSNRRDKAMKKDNDKEFVAVPRRLWDQVVERLKADRQKGLPTVSQRTHKPGRDSENVPLHVQEVEKN
jgi:hypothetical protein